mgnify:FL=1
MPYKDDVETGFKWGSAAVVILAISGLISLAWYAQETSEEEQMEATEVPLITVDGDPIKEKPEEPGGIQFPHQDKQVYKIVNPSQETAVPPVQLTPPPPKPEVMPREEAVAELQRQVEAETKSKAVEQAKPPAVAVVTPKEDTDATKPVAPKTEEAPKSEKEPNPFAAPVKEDKPAPAPKAESKPAPAPKITQSGDVALQLGAFRSNEEAEGQWKKISGKFASLTSGYRHAIVRADLGDKGIYYRLRLNGFDSTSSANQVCDQLKAQGQACFTVK